jgi:uncharacterized membrane protein
MAERQQAHRLAMESAMVPANLHQARRAQWMAWTLALSFGGAAVYLGITDHEWLAAVLGGGTVIGLATAFGRTRPMPERPGDA